MLADGQTLTELDVARGVAPPLTGAYDLRAELFADRTWYGVLFTVYPDGRQEVESDCDPLCVRKGFVDS